MGNFSFLLCQAADRQVLSKAKPPTVRMSKRYAIKITPRSADVPCRLLLLLLYSHIVPRSSPCVQESPRAALTILRLARLCLVYGWPYSSVDPKDSSM